ncbi:MAG TPA: TIGR00341 family protein, partial [Cyanobacteria bacterium UBA8803]|nr:TIGR00341 family protein [Cyanobacteria bacterium UBA8803]
MLANIRNRFNYFRRKKAQPAQLEQLQAELLAESTPNLPYLVLIVG